MHKHALALAAALTAAAAHADTDPAPHAYLQFAGGVAHVNIDCTGATSCDRNGSGGKLVAGYQFGGGFSLEAGYATFGKARGADAGTSASIKPTAFLLGGAYAVPLNADWGMNFRLGMARVKTQVDARVGTATGSASETHSKVYAGLGVSYAVSPSVRLELGLDSTQGQFADIKGTLRLVSLGATIGF